MRKLAERGDQPDLLGTDQPNAILILRDSRAGGGDPDMGERRERDHPFHLDTYIRSREEDEI